MANYTQTQFLTQLKSDFSRKFYGFTNGNLDYSAENNFSISVERSALLRVESL